MSPQSIIESQKLVIHPVFIRFHTKNKWHIQINVFQGEFIYTKINKKDAECKETIKNSTEPAANSKSEKRVGTRM